VAGEYLKKGSQVYIEGRIEYRQWQGKENQTRYSTEINVRELLMLGGAPSGGRGGVLPLSNFGKVSKKTLTDMAAAHAIARSRKA